MNSYRRISPTWDTKCTEEGENMKRRRMPALLLALCLLLSLLAGCGSGGAEAGMKKLSLDPDKAAALPFTGEVVYQAEDWIEGLFPREDGIYLRVAGSRTGWMKPTNQPIGKPLKTACPMPATRITPFGKGSYTRAKRK